MNYKKELIFEQMAKCYSEDFIFRACNQALREQDFSKVNSIGPFCFLFNELISYFDAMRIYSYTGKVWRGMILDRNQVEDFSSKKVGDYFYWPAFTSTSKKKEVAKIFAGLKEANYQCLFEIEMDSRGVDISKLSSKENEEEVLIHAGLMLKVVKFEKQKSEKGVVYFFHLTTYF